MFVRRSVASLLLGALALAACGDDDPVTTGDPDPEAADVFGDDDVDVPDGMTVTEDGFIVEEVEAGDDVATQLLIRLFGFADNVPAEGRACMSVELAPLFPDGVVPDDIVLSEELSDAIDAAAEACDVVQ